ncbi:unnamed protein product [Rotaria sp. Silwood2]|nr:unnamed protein product [Rotaria sp. Silwood2]
MTSNRNVHVPMDQSGVITTTITTNPLATCLFFLIDGTCKTVDFAYLYHSSYGLKRSEELLDNLKLLLTRFIKDLTTYLTTITKSKVTMKHFKELRLFVGGGTNTTRKAERNAVSLLINPNQFIYDQIVSLEIRVFSAVLEKKGLFM